MGEKSKYIEMPDHEVKEKKKDMFSKARHKLYNLSDVLKSSKYPSFEKQSPTTKKSRAIEYLLKPCPQQQNALGKTSSLRKQHSVEGFESAIDRNRPATVCCVADKMNGTRETAALALERPRKKLSFREPEITSCSYSGKNRKNTPEMKRSISLVNERPIRRVPSIEFNDLESQAMRVVRTVGQAFEVCHKLSITAPENDYDDQGTLTQDLVSDRLSDITSDKPKKDQYSDGAFSDKLSLQDEGSMRDLNSLQDAKDKPHLDILPPPPSTRKSHHLTSGETYASPHSDTLMGGGGVGSGSGGSAGGSSSIPAAGSALSVHHELQLLREQLEQQSQQTQAAVAQLQLAREQLAAEQSARLEAQARTHQLLVHNRELLDHIGALVAHLQGSDKANTLPQGLPHLTMPQQTDLNDSPLEHSPVMLGLNPQGLIENRAVASCLPPSPLRTSFNYPDLSSLEAHLMMQRAALGTFPAHLYSPAPNYLPPANLYAPVLNNNYATLPKKYGLQSAATQTQVDGSRKSEPRYIKPLSQMGTLTTTDSLGRLRVIVPVADDPTVGLMSSLKLDANPAPSITRSTSEKVPNRSELMSQVQRTAWARHTTK